MSTITCPNCNTPAPAGAVFCDNCGFDLRNVAIASPMPVEAAPPGSVTCAACGHPNVAGSVFCENCGAQLNVVPQPTPAQPVSPPAPAQPAPQPSVQQPAYQAPPALQSQPPAYQAPAAPQPQPPVVAPQTPPMTPTYVTGRLLIQSSNVSLPIPAGKQTVLIGREDPVSGIYPDLDLDPYNGQEAGVGRQHAQLVLKNGQVYIEDLNSVNGTALNRQKLAANQPMPVKDGDELRFGKLVLRYYQS